MATATAEPSPSAGRTGAKSIRTKLAPQFNLWRSIVKTLSYRPDPAKFGSQSRFGRVVLKGLGICWVIALPTSIINCNGNREDFMKYVANGDPRWSKCPSFSMADLEARRLPYLPTLIVDSDPWRLFLPGHEKLPYFSSTLNDDPDEAAGWMAFGQATSQSPLHGRRHAICQNLSLYTFFAQDDEYNSLVAFWARSIMQGCKRWAEDVYHTYIYSWWFMDPYERKECLHQGNRRIARRHFASGVLGYKHLPIYEGALMPLTPSHW